MAEELVPAELVGRPDAPSSDLLPRLRTLCGRREVVVRLPRPARLWWEQVLHIGSSSGSQGASQGVVTGGPLFGDARARYPYSLAERRRLDAVIDELLEQDTSRSPSTSSASRAVGCYAANVPVEAALPEFAELLAPVGKCVAERLGAVLGFAIPGSPVLYLGAGTQRTPLHFDPTENLTAVLQGAKHFRLLPPWASGQLQPRGGLLAAAVCWSSGVVPAVYSDVDAWSLPGRTDGGPASVDITVGAGEVLYLPPGWWHAVSGSPEPNVTVVFAFAPSAAKAARHAQGPRPPPSPPPPLRR